MAQREREAGIVKAFVTGAQTGNLDVLEQLPAADVASVEARGRTSFGRGARKPTKPR